jgi:hypothetical protein
MVIIATPIAYCHKQVLEPEVVANKTGFQADSCSMLDSAHADRHSPFMRSALPDDGIFDCAL